MERVLFLRLWGVWQRVGIVLGNSGSGIMGFEMVGLGLVPCCRLELGAAGDL